MNVWIAVVLLLAPIFIVLAVVRNQRRLSLLRSETVELKIDAFGVRRVLADGREEGVDWSDVTEVEVVRAKSGPHAGSGGVVIVAGDETTGCLVPLDRLEDSGLATMLHQLPGFDGARLTQAVVAEPPARTSCWVRPGSG
jgi:threonine aldolase